MRIRASIAALALSALASLTVLGTAWSQPGWVLSHQKISDIAGNLSDSLSNQDEFGGAAVGLGDLDGAGPSVAAVAVGVAGDDDGGIDRGAVYILFLNASGHILSSQKISDTQGDFTAPLLSSDYFGNSLAHLGDLDGAGPSVAALAVGAPGDGAFSHGAMYILYLRSNGRVLSYSKISDTQGNFNVPLATGDEFGGACASLGDLDGIGPSAVALAVGASGDNDGGDDRGATYVLFLTSSGIVISHVKFSDTQGSFNAILDDSDEFGCSLAGLGDLDGPGPAAGALAAGATGDDDGGTDRGAAYVMFLSASGGLLSYQKISSTSGGLPAVLENSDELGSSLGSLGDLDAAGAGVVALAAGAGGDDDGGLNRGAVYVLFLNNAGGVISHQKISDTQGGFTAPLLDADDFGVAAAALGDIDGSGAAKQTLVVGAAGDNDGGSDRGAVYVLFLGGGSAGVEDPLSEARGLSLSPATPNPFRSKATASLTIAQPSQVRIDILDVNGRIVRTLIDGRFAAGQHLATWNGLDARMHRAAPGIYFFRMSVNGGVLTTSEKIVRLE